jgi:hypothetical protein
MPVTDAKRIQEPESKKSEAEFAFVSFNDNRSPERSDIISLLASGFWLLIPAPLHTQLLYHI